MTSTSTNNSNGSDGLTAVHLPSCPPRADGRNKFFKPSKPVMKSHPKLISNISCIIFGEESFPWCSDALLKTQINKAPQSCHKPIRSLTNLNKAIQTSKKDRQTNLVNKPSASGADILVCRLSSERDLPSKGPRRRARPSREPVADFPVCFPKAGLQGSNPQPSCLTSSLPEPDSQKRGRLYLSEPQSLSRVVKVRQASQKKTPSRLDVKPSPRARRIQQQKSGRLPEDE
jgi:hypothetical protein